MKLEKTNRKTVRTLTGLAVIVALLPACTWLQSEGIAPDNQGQGVVYYLPKKIVKATFIRDKASTVSTAQKRFITATNDKNTANTALKLAVAEKKKIDLQISYLANAGVAATDKAHVNLLLAQSDKAVAVDIANAALQTATQRVSAAQQALTLAESADTNQCFEQIVITTQTPVADIDQRYQLEAHHLISRTESAKIITNKSGLLTTLDAKATDNSATILIDLARSVGAGTAAGVFQVAPPKAEEPIAEESIPNCDKKVISHFIDPLDTAAWNTFTSTITAVTGTSYEISPDAGPMSDANKNKQLLGSIAYRRELPLTLNICVPNCTDKTAVESILIHVPNHSPTEYLPINVGLFGSTELDVKFENGILVESNQKRTSELTTIAKLPFQTLEAFGEGISKVLQFKIITTGDEKSLAEKELELLEAEQRLRLKEQELEHAENAN